MVSCALESNLADTVHGAARADKHPRENTAPSADTGAMRKQCCSDSRQNYDRRLRELSLDQDTTLQALGVEALERDTGGTTAVKQRLVR